jgi:type II secretory pathway component PulK
VIDEERKININTASKELLTALLEEFGIEWEQKDLVNNILIWRGDISDTNKIYENSGYPCKSEKIQNIEELILVKGINLEDIEKLRKGITVYTEGLTNINTVSFQTLKIISRAIAKKLFLESSFADNLTTKIITLRDELGYFKDKNDIKIATTGAEETNIFNELLKNIVFKSDNFFIEVCGNAGKIKREVEVVYNRKEKAMKYWHET